MIINRLISELNYKKTKHAIFIRHAEKDIDKKNFSITRKAEEECDEIGKILKSINRSISIYSSPEHRCLQTARIINNALLTPETRNISITAFLGNPGIHVKDNTAYLEMFDKYGARGIYDLWVNGKISSPLRSPEELRNKLSTFLKKNTKNAEISLFISQSGTIAALEHALNLKSYNVDREWVGFLDGFSLRI